MAMSVKVSGTWKSVPYPRVKVSGSWKHVQNIYTRVSGAWKPLYSYWFDVGSWGSCSASCGGGTQTRTVQCKRTGGVSCDDSYCTRAGLTVPDRSQACNTQGCTTCYAHSNAPKTFFAHNATENGTEDIWYTCNTKNYGRTTVYLNGSQKYRSLYYSSSVSVGGYTYSRGSNHSIYHASIWTLDDMICAHDLCVTPN